MPSAATDTRAHRDEDLEALLRRGPDEVHEDGSSRLSVYHPADATSVTRVVGTLTASLASVFMDTLTPRIARGNFRGIHDWTAMTGYDIAVPPRLVAWTVARLPKIARIVIATSDPMTTLAVRTGNLTIKRIEHVGTREALLATLADELRRGPSTRP